MKMSDVLELPVSRDGFKLKDKCGVSQEMHVAKFADLSACVYAEFAINNHDRLVEENAKLKEDKDELVKALFELSEWKPIESYENALYEAKELLAKHK